MFQYFRVCLDSRVFLFYRNSTAYTIRVVLYYEAIYVFFDAFHYFTSSYQVLRPWEAEILERMVGCTTRGRSVLVFWSLWFG